LPESITVAADLRTSRGKNEARRTRRDGKIPAVVYGAYKEAIPVAVNPRQIVAIIRSATGYNTIFDLDIQGGEKTPVMLVDQQVDPIKGHLLHADFKRIDLSKRIRVSVPVVTEGEPMGVKVQGGLLEIVNRALEIECLPGEIPDQFVIDVSGLSIGQSTRAGEVPLTGSARLVSQAESVLAHVVALRAEEAPAVAPVEEAAAPAAAEPEVVKKGKKEEEAEAEKGKKK